jgi:hypothetical protein
MQYSLLPEIRSQHIRVSFSWHFISPDDTARLAKKAVMLVVVWRMANSIVEAECWGSEKHNAAASSPTLDLFDSERVA